jgi:hypothetical protein
MVSENKREEEEIRAELEAVAEFINKLKDTLKEIMDTLIQSISGEKLGSDIAAFYESLKNKGLPEELVEKMTEEYFKKRLEQIPSFAKIIEQFAKPQIQVRKQGIEHMQRKPRIGEEENKGEEKK